MTHKNRKKVKDFKSAGCSLLRAEGFSLLAWASFMEA
jgi:hypothetical protein